VAAVAASASLTLTSLVALAVGLPTTHASAAVTPAPATIHPVIPITVADTTVGTGLPKRALADGKSGYVPVAGVHGIPASATSVTLAVLVTNATGTGQVRIGGDKPWAIAAAAATRGQQTTASFTALLGYKGVLWVAYSGTGKVQLRLVVEAYTAGDLTGSTFHPIAPARVADTLTGRGLPARVLAGHSSAQVQIAGTAGIPRSATAVLLTVNTIRPSRAGAITAGASARTTAPVVTYTKGRQVTGSVLAALSGNGKVTLVNSSTGTVGLTANAVGYYTRDTTGLLFEAMPPRRVVDTGTGLGSPKRPLSTTALTVAVRAGAQLPASAAAVTLSLVAPSPGVAAISTGASSAAMSTVLLTSARQTADITTVVPLGQGGSVTFRATGKPVRAMVAVVGFYVAPTRQPVPPASAPPTSAPPTGPAPTGTPPTTPTTTAPGPAHPYVSSVDPVDNATGVDPQTTSVVTDLVLPNGGVATGSLNASTVTLVDTVTHQQVAAGYGTSGGADTINVSPTSALEPYRTYQFTVTPGVTDVAGVSFQPFSSTFTTGPIVTPNNNIAFDHVASGATGHSYASVTKGPDGRLYASTLDGYIYRYDIAANGTLSNEYEIDTVRTHDLAAGFYGAPTRTIIGLTFDPASTPGNLILWITDNSAYLGTTDPNNYIPDFSDHLAKLTGPNLGTYTDVLAGLPRSVKDHETNSIAFHGGNLYLTQGANNAMGQRDLTWGNRDEQLLNAAVLKLDPSKLPPSAQLPVNVATAPGGPYGGSYDPYAANAPLTLYATGLRNAFDLVWHSNGHLYAPTNGSASFGSAPGTPAVAPTVTCTHRADGRTTLPVPPQELFISTAETDFVFDVKQGSYYGHPDPARCEYALDNANPTAAVDPFEVTAYPVGTLPDPNYDLADVYDAGLHASADGAIEYTGPAFNGSLDKRLLVVRYSNGQDIETFDVAGNGTLGKPVVGIKGFTGFKTPLDLTEDTSTGDIYVTELTNPGDIELLRPRGANPAAILNVTNTNTIPSDSRMIFNRIQTPDISTPGSPQTRTTGTLHLTSTGGAPVVISALTVTGPFTLVSPPTLPDTLVAGTGHVDLTVQFTATSGRVNTGTLTIQSNAAGQATRTISLSGFFQSQPGTAEPTPHELAAMMGWTTDVPSNINDHGQVQADGDEVLARSFSRVDPTQPVTVRQIAEFSTFPSSSTLSYYNLATPDAPVTPAVTVSKDTWAQSVLPQGSAGAAPANGSFLPPQARFGLKVDTELSDDTLNNATVDVSNGCSGPCGHHLRFFPVKDAAGRTVTGSYFVVVDLSGAGQDDDYNDAAYVVTNIQP
jgi:hypothetical protein